MLNMLKKGSSNDVLLLNISHLLSDVTVAAGMQQRHRRHLQTTAHCKAVSNTLWLPSLCATLPLPNSPF
jgi:hypothetical protein